MNMFSRISVAAGLGILFLTSSVQSAQPLFKVVSNGNNLTITTSSSTILNAGIKSTGFSFSNCTPNTTDGYCHFSISKALNQTLILAGPATQPQLQICNFDANPMVCQNINLGERFAYVVNYLPLVNNVSNFSISLCPINSSTGQLGNCTLYQDPTFNISGPSGIALNSAGTYLYITTSAYIGGQPNTISVCPLNSDGSMGTCTATPPEFYAPTALTLNATGAMAYVSNDGIGPSRTGGNTISICPLSASDGSFINCNTFADASFKVPGHMAFNNAGTLAYIPNLYPVANAFTVSKCSVNPTDGSMSSCVALTDPTFLGPSDITLNNKGTGAYVTNYYNVTNGTFSTTVSYCPINVNRGGIFKPCTALFDPSFSGPIGIQLNATETFAYITNYNNNQISVCPVNQDGSFGTCTAANSSIGLRAPKGIVLF